MRKVTFHTLGCKVNQYETEALKERFTKAGWEVVPENEPADCYVINTCTVTNLADRKSRQFIRRAAKANPEALIVACGCYVQVKPEEAAAIEGVGLICGTNEKQNLPEYVEKYLAEHEKPVNAEMTETGDLSMGACGADVHVLDYSEITDYRSDGIITSMDSRSRAFIKIEEGCDRFCSYCVIPYARGRVRSRGPEEVLEEARALIENGFKEIVLTGINTALYGKDLGMGGIEPLIGMIDALPGDFRIRLSSLEPTVIDAEYVKGLLKYGKLAHHLHLSVQSGSDAVLSAMNRRYDRTEFLDIVRVLRDFDPLYGISSDIIVGFPGETEEDFADSVRLVSEAGFSKVHVFRYSRRDGTKAAVMPGQVQERVKTERGTALAEAGEKEVSRFIVANAGRTERVLFEQEEDGYLTGYTGNYIKAYLPIETAGTFADGGADTLLGNLVTVTLVEPFRDGILCEI